MKRLRYFVLLLAFGLNVLALVAGILGLLTTYNKISGPTLFFSVVLIISPLLNIAVLIDRRWAKFDSDGYLL